MVNRDITEDFQYDFSPETAQSSFSLTDVAYDITINNLPFIIKSDNQNPYRRETAPYKKEQFDNSNEPGEQSLTGWWLRSQTSWHNGAGINFYEPGTDYSHVSHKYKDSRGIDIWTVGESKLLPELFHAYEGDNGINAAAGQWTDTGVAKDCLVSGDSKGNLKRVTLNNNSAATVSNFYNGATYPEGHNGTNYSFTSATTDGSNYYAVCKRAIHTGNINTLSSDEVAINFSTSAVNADATNTFIKYVKGFVLFGLGRDLHNLSIVPFGAGRTTSTHNHSGGTDSLGTNFTSHLNPSWIWNDATSSPGPLYVSGNGGSNGEVWKVPFDTTGTTINLDMPNSSMVLSLPDGELVKSIHYYLGYLAIGTNRGVRICQIDSNDNLTMGPLLLESKYGVNGFTEKDSYLYAATKADAEGGYVHGVLVRIDLATQFEDGTFAYSYDLEYRSSINVDNESPFTATNSDASEVYLLDNRIVMVIEENGSGELLVEHSTRKRNTGWLQTGKIRYGTVEPKTFKFLNVNADTQIDSSIGVSTIVQNGNSFPLIDVTDNTPVYDNISMKTPSTPVEFLSLYFKFNCSSDGLISPVLNSYQIKATPVIKKQRLIQYALQCYDSEMDKFNNSFGYIGRAYDLMSSLEQLEETSQFVYVKDYRTDEAYEGLIEEIRFTNESSPDKNSSGFGGLLLVTVRKT